MTDTPQRRCKTCAFMFMPSATSAAFCRVNAPDRDIQEWAIWPEVNPEADWCGSWFDREHDKLRLRRREREFARQTEDELRQILDEEAMF